MTTVAGNPITATYKGIGIVRCSGQKQMEKYGPASQKRDINEGIPHFPLGKLDIIKTIEYSESASGWNRKKWNRIIDECLECYHRGEAQVIVLPRVDRETRFLVGSLLKLIEAVEAGIHVYYAQEHLLLDLNDKDKWEEYLVLALEAQAYARVLRRNTMRGKQEAAEDGKIPTGFGPNKGYLGLRYYKKKLVHTPQIEIARRILKDYISGKSIRQIHQELLAEEVCGVGGHLIDLSSVNSVLNNAKVYAGVYTYNKKTTNPIEVLGLIEPIITMEETEVIAERKKRNKERSLGFGKRKWLSGRVFCEICRSRYSLDTHKGCYCNRSDRKHLTKCPAPKMGLRILSKLVYETLIFALSEPETIMEQVQKNHDKWEAESTYIKELNQKKEDSKRHLNVKMKRLKDLYVDGDYTHEEYTKERDDIKKKCEKELDNLPELPPEPPTPHEIQRTYDILKYYKPYRLHLAEVLRNPQDEWASELAELTDLKVIIGHPLPDTGTEFSAHIITNLPFPKQSEELREELLICADCNYTYSTLASDPDDSCPNCGEDKLVPQWGDNKPEPFPNEENPIAMVFTSSR